jgi:hypothetical protein
MRRFAWLRDGQTAGLAIHSRILRPWTFQTSCTSSRNARLMASFDPGGRPAGFPEKPSRNCPLLFRAPVPSGQKVFLPSSESSSELSRQQVRPRRDLLTRVRALHDDDHEGRTGTGPFVWTGRWAGSIVRLHQPRDCRTHSQRADAWPGSTVFWGFPPGCHPPYEGACE